MIFIYSMSMCRAESGGMRLVCVHLCPVCCPVCLCICRSGHGSTVDPWTLQEAVCELATAVRYTWWPLHCSQAGDQQHWPQRAQLPQHTDRWVVIDWQVWEMVDRCVRRLIDRWVRWLTGEWCLINRCVRWLTGEWWLIDRWVSGRRVSVFGRWIVSV